MNDASCLTVGLRNSGEVSAMKSVQNFPASSSVEPSAGSARSTSSSMKPTGPSFPAHELSAAKTMVCPRSRRIAARPMHWFVGPYADSGQNMIVKGGGVDIGERSFVFGRVGADWDDTAPAVWKRGNESTY